MAHMAHGAFNHWDHANGWERTFNSNQKILNQTTYTHMVRGLPQVLGTRQLSFGKSQFKQRSTYATIYVVESVLAPPLPGLKRSHQNQGAQGQEIVSQGNQNETKHLDRGPKHGVFIHFEAISLRDSCI